MSVRQMLAWATLSSAIVTCAVACDRPKSSPPAAVPPAAATPAVRETAVDFARRYTDMTRTGRAVEAVEANWDLDAMFAEIYGDALKGVTDTDRAEMRRLMLAFLREVFASPKIAAKMSTGTFTGFAARGLPGNRTAVDFTVDLGSGRTIPNTLVLAPGGDGQWKIVDAGNKGTLMNAALRENYRANSGGAGPLEFTRAMAASGGAR